MGSVHSNGKASMINMGTAGPSQVLDAAPTDIAPPAIHRGWRFWAIFPALSITAPLSAIEATIISTAPISVSAGQLQ